MDITPPAKITVSDATGRSLTMAAQLEETRQPPREPGPPVCLRMRPVTVTMADAMWPTRTAILDQPPQLNRQQRRANARKRE